jgi:hypothetical protein
VVTAAAAAGWVDGKLAAAAELWRALTQHCRSSLDDFTLVPVGDDDWDMLDRCALPHRGPTRPPLVFFGGYIG